jgi:hypothetical protein
MELRDLIRICVLRSNAHRPFSSINKAPYCIAIRVFTHFCRRFQEIAAVYVRRRLVGRSWIPALSDIDLTVLIRKDLGLEREYLFLRRFWQGMQLVRKVFPMIGEVEILNEDQMEIWLKNGFEGVNFEGWQQILGNAASPVLERPVIPNCDVFQAYNFALSFYLHTFYRGLHQTRHPHYLLKQDSFRILRKINKCLSAIGANSTASSDKINELPPDIDEVICLMISSLDNGLSSIASSTNGCAGKNEGNEQDYLPVDIYSSIQDSNNVSGFAALIGWEHVIRSVYQTHDKRVYVILRDGIDFSTMKQCVGTIWDAGQLGGGRLIIVGEKLFQHLLQRYYPFEYAHLAEFRILLLGTDILPDIAPPGKSSFVNYLIGQVPLMIVYSYSVEFIFPNQMNYYRGEQFDFVSQNMLFLKCYLEKGIINARRHKLLADCLRHSPHHLKRMRMLQRNLENRPADEPSWEWFKLLRPMADEICSLLSTHCTHNQTGCFGE